MYSLKKKRNSSHIRLTFGFSFSHLWIFWACLLHQTVIYFKALANTGEFESIHQKFLLVSNLLNEFWSNTDLEKAAYFMSRFRLCLNWDVNFKCALNLCNKHRKNCECCPVSQLIENLKFFQKSKKIPKSKNFLKIWFFQKSEYFSKI